jgi:hypothetical protein
MRGANVNRRVIVLTFAALPLTAFLRSTATLAQDPGNPLASWNEGEAKRAIIDFVQATIDHSSPRFVPVSERIAV